MKKLSKRDEALVSKIQSSILLGGIAKQKAEKELIAEMMEKKSDWSRICWLASLILSVQKSISGLYSEIRRLRGWLPD
jgi:hypothetical protein